MHGHRAGALSGPSYTPWLRAWDVEAAGVSPAGYPWNQPFLDEWLTHGGTVAGSQNGWE